MLSPLSIASSPELDRRSLSSLCFWCLLFGLVFVWSVALCVDFLFAVLQCIFFRPTPSWLPPGRPICVVAMES